MNNFIPYDHTYISNSVGYFGYTVNNCFITDVQGIWISVDQYIGRNFKVKMFWNSILTMKFSSQENLNKQFKL